MRNPTVGSPQKTKSPGIQHVAGCCGGQFLGCGFSFIASWVIALGLSWMATAVFGRSQGIDVLIAGLTCAVSLLLGLIFSFLTGRLFPVIGKKGK